MERKRITCPGTAHLEEIDYERTPFGILIAGCSRFEPRSAIQCDCECARRIDRRDRRDVDDRTERVLVVSANRDAPTLSIAQIIARELMRDGLIVELADADSGFAPPPADYEAVVLGSSERSGRYARSVVDYIVRHRDALAAMPAFFFSVSASGDGNDAATHIASVTEWHPTHIATFVGPVARSKFPRLRRWLAGRNSHATAASRDVSRVHAFAMMIADVIPDVEIATAWAEPK